MRFETGSRLGPYEIVAPLGAGGMGEVYRAKDPRLGRELALKILPVALAKDEERLARFEREARAASGLNHPNIVTIYDIGQADTISYISMELVQGRTLRELVSDGPLAPKRLLPIAVQIADGLAKAHDAGIVHRDLKPENVMVTRDGVVKILDFGLAKLGRHAIDGVSKVATAVPDTQPGMVMGTVGYMSPEQASGRAVDFRSDQFSFGSILYELTTGTRAFARTTAAETQAAIIRDEPLPVQSAVPNAPIALRWMIERCLTKDPDERYASTRDLARDLTNLRNHASEISASQPTPVAARRRRTMSVIVGALLLAASALALMAWFRQQPEPALRPVRFTVPIPRGGSYAPSEISRGASISPDGTRLVIEAYMNGRRHLFLRRLDSEETVQLEGSTDATSHFWSPDSRFIAFYANGRLKKIPADGGVPVEICAAGFETVGTWNREGTILFSQLYPPGIFRVSDRGGEPTLVKGPDKAKGIFSLLWPHFLPDGKRFLYLTLYNRRETDDQPVRALHVGSIESDDVRVVTPLDSRAEYASGHLLYVREGALFAQPFDADAAAVTGEPSLVTSTINYFFGPANAAFSVSQEGILAYATAAEPSRLVWLDRTGREVGQLGSPSVVGRVRISPDGRRVAVDVEERKTGTSDIWLFELTRGVATRLHHDAIDEISPVWAPDGAKLFLRSDKLGPPDINELTIGVPGSERLVFADETVQQPEDVSPDGRLLVYLNDLQTTADIFLLPLAGTDREPTPWVRTRFDETSPRFSPDGRWIAYEADDSGDSEVYIARVDGAADKRRISTTGGSRPRWRRDGRELFYVAPGGLVMSVAVTPGPQLEMGVPTMLFRTASEILTYDVTPDGSRFLANLPIERIRESPVRVIVNWQQALNRRTN